MEIFPVDRIRSYRRHRRRLSHAQRELARSNLMVVFGMTPILLYVAALPIFISEATITAISTILIGTLVPVIGLGTQVKIRRIKSLTLTTGFVAFFTTALTLVQSRLETGIGILSRDVTTLDFKLSVIIVVMTVGLMAIGLITSTYPQRAESDPRRYT